MNTFLSPFKIINEFLYYDWSHGIECGFAGWFFETGAYRGFVGSEWGGAFLREESTFLSLPLQDE